MGCGSMGAVNLSVLERRSSTSGVSASLLGTNSAWSAAPSKSVMIQVCESLFSTTALGSSGSSYVKARAPLPEVATPIISLQDGLDERSKSKVVQSIWSMTTW